MRDNLSLELQHKMQQKNLLSKVFLMTVLFFLQVHSVHQVIPVRVMGKASPIDRYIIVEGELVILSFYAQI